MDSECFPKKEKFVWKEGYRFSFRRFFLCCERAEVFRNCAKSSNEKGMNAFPGSNLFCMMTVAKA